MGEHETWIDADDPTAEHPADRYDVQHELGRGAMGVVEAVFDRRLERVVARKSLRSTRATQGFRREARMASALEHPGIVPIYDASDGPEGPWYTMRRIEGRSLQEALEQAADLAGRLGLLPAFLRLCEAMAYAHRQGVMHLDLKPANVMLGPYGEVVVVDFGLATSIEAAKAGRIVGTPAYMSPEAALGGVPTLQSDVWSLGAVLYHLLSGRPPWSGSPAEIVERVRGEDPEALHTLVPDAPPELLAIVAKAMQRDLKRRYPDARALRADVEAFTTGRLVGAYSYSQGELLRRFVRQYRGYLRLAGGFLVAFLLFGSFATWRIDQARRRAVSAEAERTQQLAIALEARARALGDVPVARQVAQRALALDPSLPWARGVLARLGTETVVQQDRRIELTGCSDGALTAFGLALICEDTLVLVDPDTGEELDRIPWTRSILAVGDDWISGFVGGNHLTMGALDEGGLSSHEVPVERDERWDVAIVTPDADGRPTVFAFSDSGGQRLELVDGRFRYAASLSVEHASQIESRGGRHLLFHIDGASLCGETTQSCRALPLPGTVQRATWLGPDRLVLLTTSGELFLLDGPEGPLRLIQRLAPGDSLAMTALGPHVFAILHNDGSVRLYDEVGSTRLVRDASPLEPRALIASGEDLWVVGKRGSERWQLEQSDPAIRRLPDGVGALALQDGALLAAYRDRVVRFGDQQPETVVEAPSLVKDLAVDGDVLWVAPARHQVLRVSGGEVVSHPSHHPRRIGVTDGKVLVASYDQKLWIDDEETDHVTLGDLAVANGRALFETRRGVATLLDVDAAEIVWNRDFGQELWGLALTSDAHRAAIALDDGTVFEIDFRTSEMTRLPGPDHAAYVAALAYSPSGRRIASASWDGTSRVWLDGRLEAALEGHRGRVTQLVFADDDTLYTGSWDQTVRRWALEP